MFKILRKIVSNKTYPSDKNLLLDKVSSSNKMNPSSLAYIYPKFPHYNATIIQLGWLGSPRYRKLLKKKLKRKRKCDYKHYAAITIQLAWFRSGSYRRGFVKKLNLLLSRVEKLDMKFVDEYISGIERLIR